MIPLRDTIRSRSFPIVNVSLIALNVVVFVFQLGLGQAGFERFVGTYGVVPARVVEGLAQAPLSPETWVPLFTAMFLHGNWFHILGNMLYLWVFGDNVEDTLGHRGYILFYLAVGLVGNFAHVLTNADSFIPTIGASGAVAGVLGAYFILFPRSRILALVPLLFILTFMELPAVVFLFLWFGLQLLNGLTSIAAPGNLVAWWAHIGGFIAGMLLIKVLRPVK